MIVKVERVYYFTRRQNSIFHSSAPTDLKVNVIVNINYNNHKNKYNLFI